MDSVHPAWQASAAYLYLLHLPDALIAWEYLRRNSQYRQQWKRTRATADMLETQWGLRYREDPTRDGRYANPVWFDENGPDVRLVPDESATALRFDLWAIAGRKTLLYDGRRLLLTDVTMESAFRLLLDAGLNDDMPFAYALSSSPDANRLVRAMPPIIALLQGDCPSATPHPRPSRSTLVHMRTIHTIDAVDAGASHRETAVALFGETAVAERWEPDSELRAQVRQLIKRGRELREGGYRRLTLAAPYGRQ